MEGTSEQERRAGYKWEPDWEGNPSIVAFEFESAEFLVLKIWTFSVILSPTSSSYFIPVIRVQGRVGRHNAGKIHVIHSRKLDFIIVRMLGNSGGL